MVCLARDFGDEGDDLALELRGARLEDLEEGVGERRGIGDAVEPTEGGEDELGGGVPGEGDLRGGVGVAGVSQGVEQR